MCNIFVLNNEHMRKTTLKSGYTIGQAKVKKSISVFKQYHIYENLFTRNAWEVELPYKWRYKKGIQILRKMCE